MSQDWTEPGAHLVAPGIHRIPLPLPQDGLRAVNVYAIEDGDGITLIDGGWALDAGRRALGFALGEAGHAVSDISRILVTHAHHDHYTMAVALRREVGALVALGEGERRTLETLHDPLVGPLDGQFSTLERAGAGELVAALRQAGRGGAIDLTDWAQPDVWYGSVTTVAVGGRELSVIPTPGHTAGHVVFADLEAGVLFGGDHVLPHITPSIGFEVVASRTALGDYLRSLAAVRGLPDLRLLPAHGPVAASTHARVAELCAHHDDRLAESRAAVAGGATDGLSVARELRWTRRGIALDALDEFNQMLAVIETMAHLDLLAARGDLRSDAGKPERYAPVVDS